ncbi:MAG: hypothetical protein GKR93_16875 [Gammaproteobacteria bacterium]|nr:hypothetical protein [Gammaproteobacteria bacterium]
MGNISFYQSWFMDALFWLGVCIALFGGLLLLAPSYAIRLSQSLNRWVSTETFFQVLDKPHNHDRYFYRWHKVLGLLLLLASLYIFYMMFFQTNIESAAALAPIFKQNEMNEWLYEALKIFFIGVSILIGIIGVIVMLRPSALKSMEEKANRWFHTGESLQKLDSQFVIPENILPGNVRLFGSLVLLGGVYIMASSTGLIF